jgi:hypothetical protein
MSGEESTDTHLTFVKKKFPTCFLPGLNTSPVLTGTENTHVKNPPCFFEDAVCVLPNIKWMPLEVKPEFRLEQKIDIEEIRMQGMGTVFHVIVVKVVNKTPT